jgi:hypothetical protein
MLLLPPKLFLLSLKFIGLILLVWIKVRMILFVSMSKLNLKYLLRSNLNLNSFILALTVVLLVKLDHIVFRFTLRSLVLRSMIPRKVKLVKKSFTHKCVPRKKFREYKHDSSFYRKSCGGLFNMMMDILTRLDKLDKGHNTAPGLKRLGLGRLIPFTP